MIELMISLQIELNKKLYVETTENAYYSILEFVRRFRIKDLPNFTHRTRWN